MKLAIPKIELTLSPRARKILSYSGYPLFYLFCLFIFGYWTFPYDRLKERIIGEFEASRAEGGTPQTLEIASLGPYWLSGIDARGVELTTPRTSPAEGEKPVTKLVLDRVHARVSFLPLLIGRVSVTFGIKAFGGEIDGWTRPFSDERRITLDIDGIDVGQVGPLADTVGLPMSGMLTGSAELVVPEQKIAKATGTLECTIADLAVGDGKAKLQGKLALPKMNVGRVDLSAEIKDGTLKLGKLAAAGQDLDIGGEGKVSLRDSFGDSLSDVYLRFKFSDGYKGRNDVTKSLFGTPGSNMPALFELADPRIKSSKRGDGFYGWHMVGPLKDPRFEPAPTSPGGAVAPPGKPRNPAAPPANGGN